MRFGFSHELCERSWQTMTFGEFNCRGSGARHGSSNIPIHDGGSHTAFCVFFFVAISTVGHDENSIYMYGHTKQTTINRE